MSTQNTTSEHRKMVIALTEIVVTRLRNMGFNGSFPHFRRHGKEKIDLLTFQFDKYGGGFVLEISKCPPDGTSTHWGEHIPPNKVNAWDMHPSKRVRLQPGAGNSPSSWFRFDRHRQAEEVYLKTANEVLPYLEIAEKWWKGDGNQ